MPPFSLSNRVKRVRFTSFRFHFWLTLIITILFTQIYFWFGNCVFSKELSLAKSYSFRIWNKKWQKETWGNYQVFVYQRYRESTIHNRAIYSKSRCKILLLRKHKKKNERHTEIQFNTFYKDGWIRPVKIIQNNVYFTNIDL